MTRLKRCTDRRVRLGLALHHQQATITVFDSRTRVLLRAFKNAQRHEWAAAGNFPVRDSCPFFHPPVVPGWGYDWLKGCYCGGKGWIDPLERPAVDAELAR